MFGVLIESRAGKQRRAGGAMASVVLHGALIAGAVALTAHTATSTPIEKPSQSVVTYIKPPEPPKPTTSTQSSPSTPTLYVPPDQIVVRAPLDVPNKLPPIDHMTAFDENKIVIVGGTGPLTRNPHDTVSATIASDAVRRSADVDRIAALVDAPRPQYPDNLRLAGVSGRVLVQFVVDTLGRVEKESVHVMESTHARFENSVREVLPRLRFRAAEVSGAKVRMLVEMPFEFSLERR